MIDFDFEVVTLAQQGYRIELRSWEEKDRYYGHELIVAAKNEQPVSFKVDTHERLINAITKVIETKQLETLLENTRLPLPQSTSDDPTITRKRKPPIQDGMDELEILDLMVKGGWTYRIIILPIYRDSSAQKTLTIQRGETVLNHTSSINADWSKILYMIAKEAILNYYKKPEPNKETVPIPEPVKTIEVAKPVRKKRTPAKKKLTNAQKITKLRELSGLNAKQVGQLVNVSQSTVYNWLKGANVPTNHVDRVDALLEKIQNLPGETPEEKHASLFKTFRGKTLFQKLVAESHPPVKKTTRSSQKK